MKRTFILCFLFMLFFVPSIHAQFEGTFGIGVHTSYGTDVNRPGAGLHAHYYRTNNLRFAPAVTWFLERNGTGMWMTDVDVHYIIPLSYMVSLYPIGGAHYSQWKYEEANTKNRLGANLGLGYQYDIAYRARANLEMKYQFIPDHSQILITAGIGFWF